MELSIGRLHQLRAFAPLFSTQQAHNHASCLACLSLSLSLFSGHRSGWPIVIAQRKANKKGQSLSFSPIEPASSISFLLSSFFWPDWTRTPIGGPEKVAWWAHNTRAPLSLRRLVCGRLCAGDCVRVTVCGGYSAEDSLRQIVCSGELCAQQYTNCTDCPKTLTPICLFGQTTPTD